MINIGIVGYGYWGPNLARNFNSTSGCKIVSICDLLEENLIKAKQIYSSVYVTTDYHEVVRSKSIDAVVIATPVSSHFMISKEALENGKHIFVEKPFTFSVRDAEELVTLADKKHLKIMVDHTFLFTGAVKCIKKSLEADALGRLFYYDSTRIRLGAFQGDVDVIWDLAPHDFSILDYLIKSKPTKICANGVDNFNTGRVNLAYITLHFENNMIAHIHLNWLAPLKIRKTFLSGQKKMLVWDDVEADEKIKIYDAGVDIKSDYGMRELMVDYRSGDVLSPRIERKEALEVEAQYFIECINTDEEPINNGHSGLRIVTMLEAASMSLRNGGEMISLNGKA